MQKQLISPAYSEDNLIYLKPVKIHDVEIDICPLSGGVWFDRFELKKFDEAHESIDELLALLPTDPAPPEITSERRSPRHPEAIMHQQPYGPKGMNGVLTVDICPVCAGIWLDYNELQKIRELYPTEAEKQKLIKQFVDNAFKK